MNNIRITFLERVDRTDIITALADDGHYLLDVQNLTGSGTIDTELDVAGMDATYKEALYKVIDAASARFEPVDSLVWVVNLDGKEFQLTDSYIRAETATTKPQPSLPDGAPLTVSFEVAGFVTPLVRQIDLWFNMDFNPVDLALLEEIGISLVGNGASFEITNDRDCKVSFSKPEAASENYVVHFAQQGQIITYG